MSPEVALERMQADGRITVEDADEVRNFAGFLKATAGIPKQAARRTREQQSAFLAAYREHYPDDYAKAVAEARERTT